MINKEEIEMEMEAIKWLCALDVKSEYEASNKEILLSYIDKLEDRIQNGERVTGTPIVFNLQKFKLEQAEKRIKELEEINKEHQKINGNLQKRITELEKENKTLKAINRGKSIRELGVSDLYGEKQ